MSADTNHQECVDLTISYFRERGITCEDYELQIGDDPAKRPDLILPDFHTFIEVKTFSPQQQELEKAQRIAQDLMEGKVVTYWPPTFYNRFHDDLSHSRRKFRVYPEYHTAVLFYDLHSVLHQQSPEELLLGQEYVEVAFPEAEPRDPIRVNDGRKERQLRRDKNTEIGSVVFHTGHNTFRIFHNGYANPVRQIDQNIFALPDDEHFKYIDDSRNPRLVPLS
jgi:hypothetical protein